jgi:hypothetical protein
MALNQYFSDLVSQNVTIASDDPAIHHNSEISKPPPAPKVTQRDLFLGEILSRSQRLLLEVLDDNIDRGCGEEDSPTVSSTDTRSDNEEEKEVEFDEYSEVTELICNKSSDRDRLNTLPLRPPVFEKLQQAQGNRVDSKLKAAIEQEGIATGKALAKTPASSSQLASNTKQIKSEERKSRRDARRSVEEKEQDFKISHGEESAINAAVAALSAKATISCLSENNNPIAEISPKERKSEEKKTRLSDPSRMNRNQSSREAPERGVRRHRSSEGIYKSSREAPAERSVVRRSSGKLIPRHYEQSGQSCKTQGEDRSRSLEKTHRYANPDVEKRSSSRELRRSCSRGRIHRSPSKNNGVGSSTQSDQSCNTQGKDRSRSIEKAHRYANPDVEKRRSLSRELRRSCSRGRIHHSPSKHDGVGSTTNRIASKSEDGNGRSNRRCRSKSGEKRPSRKPSSSSPPFTTEKDSSRKPSSSSSLFKTEKDSSRKPSSSLLSRDAIPTQDRSRGEGKLRSSDRINIGKASKAPIFRRIQQSPANTATIAVTNKKKSSDRESKPANELPGFEMAASKKVTLGSHLGNPAQTGSQNEGDENLSIADTIECSITHLEDLYTMPASRANTKPPELGLLLAQRIGTFHESYVTASSLAVCRSPVKSSRTTHRISSRKSKSADAFGLSRSSHAKLSIDIPSNRREKENPRKKLFGPQTSQRSKSLDSDNFNLVEDDAPQALGTNSTPSLPMGAPPFPHAHMNKMKQSKFSLERVSDKSLTQPKPFDMPKLRDEPPISDDEPFPIKSDPRTAPSKSCHGRLVQRSEPSLSSSLFSSPATNINLEVKLKGGLLSKSEHRHKVSASLDESSFDYFLDDPTSKLADAFGISRSSDAKLSIDISSSRQKKENPRKKLFVRQTPQRTKSLDSDNFDLVEDDAPQALGTNWMGPPPFPHTPINEMEQSKASLERVPDKSLKQPKPFDMPKLRDELPIFDDEPFPIKSDPRTAPSKSCHGRLVQRSEPSLPSSLFSSPATNNNLEVKLKDGLLSKSEHRHRVCASLDESSFDYFLDDPTSKSADAFGLSRPSDAKLSIDISSSRREKENPRKKLFVRQTPQRTKSLDSDNFDLVEDNAPQALGTNSTPSLPIGLLPFPHTPMNKMKQSKFSLERVPDKSLKQPKPFDMPKLRDKIPISDDEPFPIKSDPRTAPSKSCHGRLVQQSEPSLPSSLPSSPATNNNLEVKLKGGLLSKSEHSHRVFASLDESSFDSFLDDPTPNRSASLSRLPADDERQDSREYALEKANESPNRKMSVNGKVFAELEEPSESSLGDDACFSSLPAFPMQGERREVSSHLPKKTSLPSSLPSSPATNKIIKVKGMGGLLNLSAHKGFAELDEPSKCSLGGECFSSLPASPVQVERREFSPRKTNETSLPSSLPSSPDGNKKLKVKAKGGLISMPEHREPPTGSSINDNFSSLLSSPLQGERQESKRRPLGKPSDLGSLLSRARQYTLAEPSVCLPQPSVCSSNQSSSTGEKHELSRESSLENDNDIGVSQIMSTRASCYSTLDESFVSLSTELSFEAGHRGNRVSHISGQVGLASSSVEVFEHTTFQQSPIPSEDMGFLQLSGSPSGQNHDLRVKTMQVKCSGSTSPDSSSDDSSSDDSSSEQNQYLQLCLYSPDKDSAMSPGITGKKQQGALFQRGVPRPSQRVGGRPHLPPLPSMLRQFSS